MKLKTRNRRRGAAIVEMAICLPVLVLLTFGTIETAGAIFVKQTLTSAAHEGALAGMVPSATEASVRDRIDLILQLRKINNCNVNITPSGTAFDQLTPGDTYTIEISRANQSMFINLGSVAVRVSTQHP